MAERGEDPGVASCDLGLQNSPTTTGYCAANWGIVTRREQKRKNRLCADRVVAETVGAQHIGGFYVECSKISLPKIYLMQ